jgi:hypothetical protein
MGSNHITIYLSGRENCLRLEPFRANESREKINKQERGNDTSYVDHQLFSSNVFARDQKRVAKGHADDSQREHRGQPDCQIHFDPLLCSMEYSARAMPENLAWIALWSGSSGAQSSQK